MIKFKYKMNIFQLCRNILSVFFMCIYIYIYTHIAQHFGSSDKTKYITIKQEKVDDIFIQTLSTIKNMI